MADLEHQSGCLLKLRNENSLCYDFIWSCAFHNWPRVSDCFAFHPQRLALEIKR